MNKKFFHRSVQVALAVSFYSFLSSASAEDSGEVIATVNGTNITNQVFALYGEKRIGVPMGTEFPEAKRNELIDELISRELIYQDAIKEGLDKQENVILQIQEQAHNLITRIRIGKLLEDNPPSDTLMKSIYQAQIVDPASTEYRARHILSDDVDTANAIILELNNGSDFATLAKEKSTGPSATDGGDLGWFSPNQMVKPFSDAVELLKPGEHSKRPVKTRFGWHVIKLEETRKVDPPPFDSVKEQIVEFAQNQIISGYLRKLREDATIEVK